LRVHAASIASGKLTLRGRAQFWLKAFGSDRGCNHWRAA
jgi:hypothetical protein